MTKITPYQAANMVPIESLLEYWGGQSHQDGQANKWKLPSLGNFSVDGQRWWNFNHREGGFGAVKLVCYVEDISNYENAVKWLEENFANEMPVDAQDAQLRRGNSAFKERKEFEPPAPDPTKLSDIEDYLIRKRFLPEPLIKGLTKVGKIYADERANCIFISDAAAENRSTKEDFKGSVVGSDKSQTGFTIPADPAKNRKIVGICEAAIDALSYRAMYPGVSAISSNGAGQLALQYIVTLQAIEHGYSISMATDADQAGDDAAHHLASCLYLRYFLRTQHNLPFQLIDEAIHKHDLKITNYTIPEGSTGFMKFPPQPWDFKWTYKPKAGREESKLLPIEQNVEHTQNIANGGLYMLTNKLKFKRHRPASDKDWNAILIKRRKAGFDYEIPEKSSVKIASAVQAHPNISNEPAAPPIIEQKKTRDFKQSSPKSNPKP